MIALLELLQLPLVTTVGEVNAPEDQPIPEHVKLAVIEAMKAKDFDRLASLSPEDQAAAQRYITSLLAYDILYPREP